MRIRADSSRASLTSPGFATLMMARRPESTTGLICAVGVSVTTGQGFVGRSTDRCVPARSSLRPRPAAARSRPAPRSSADAPARRRDGGAVRLHRSLRNSRRRSAPAHRELAVSPARRRCRTAGRAVVDQGHGRGARRLVGFVVGQCASPGSPDRSRRRRRSAHDSSAIVQSRPAAARQTSGLPSSGPIKGACRRSGRAVRSRRAGGP